MVGFAGVLKSELQSKFCLIISEDRPGLYSIHYMLKLLREHSEEASHLVHLLSFVHKEGLNVTNVKPYDFIRNSFPGLGPLYSTLLSNADSSKRNILILDDLSLLSIYSNRDSKSIQNFFKQISKNYSQVMVFCTVDTVSKEEISLLCNLAEHVVILKNPEEEGSREFLCNLLTIKPSGKTSLDQVYFEVKGGIVTDSSRKLDKSVAARDNSDDIMRSLTTFKLTIEDRERESKNQLYLPYLDAQRTTVPNPEEDFYDDDDDDDDD